MTSQQTQYITSSIHSETLRLATLNTSDDKFQCLNNIICLKKLINYVGQDSIYLDFKLFLKNYIDAVEEKDSGYDNISIARISTQLDGMCLEEQISLLKFFKKLLIIKAYLDEAKDCDLHLQVLKLEFYKKNKSLLNYGKLVAIWSSSSFWKLIGLLFCFYCLASLFLMPAYFESFQLFKVTYITLSSNFLMNHLLNVLSIFFDLDNSSMKIEANSPLALILMIMSKIIYITILVNFLTKKFVEFIKIND